MDEQLTFQRLLVPLDGSRLAESALPIAAAVAQAFEARIVLLHILERHAPRQVHGERHLTTLVEADEYLTQIGERLAAQGISVERHTHEVPEGDVARSIAEHAADQQIDLIVLCTHGEGGLGRALWGTIAQHVLQRGDVPVLLTRPTTPLPAGFAPGSIMVPLDATAAAEAALGPASAFARRFGATLRLVVVVATPETVPTGQQPVATILPSATRALLDVETDQAARYLDGLARQIRQSGLAVVTEVRRGDAASQLATDADEHADGLAVVATHGRAGVQAIWSGSVAAKLLARTSAPVLLVRIVEA
jgi:nucleotide-binding universal stress UspA family protein